MKIRSIYLAAAMLAVLTLVLPAGSTRAVYQDEESGAALGTFVQVSKNNTNWDNYSNTDSITPTGQTLVVKPGDTIYFRGQVWNPGDPELGAPLDPLLIAVIKNDKYLEDIDPFTAGNADLDGNGIDYQVIPGPPPVEGYKAFGLTFSDPLVPKGPLGPGNVPEEGTITAKVKSDVPNGTVIEGDFALFMPNQQQFQTNGGIIKRAMADPFTDMVDQLPERSSVKILVTTPTVTTLPATGANENLNRYVPIIGLTAMFGSLIGIYVVRNRKVAKAKASK